MSNSTKEKVYAALRLPFEQFEADVIATEDEAVYEADVEAIEREGGAVARFTAKWSPKQVADMKRVAGLDLEALDLEGENADNIGSACAMTKFITDILSRVSDKGSWHPLRGPGADGPKHKGDQILMCHAPMLLASLRDLFLVLARVLATGDTNVSLSGEFVQTMNMVANLYRNIRDESPDPVVQEIVDTILAAVAALGTQEIPSNPLNGGRPPTHEA